MTIRPAIFDKSVMMSSLIPSEKYLPELLSRRQIMAIAACGPRLAVLGCRPLVAVACAMSGCHRQIRIGRSMFLTLI